MTRSYEDGENEYTTAAKRESMRTRVPVEIILQRMLDDAKRAKDKAAAKKYVQENVLPMPGKKPSKDGPDPKTVSAALERYGFEKFLENDARDGLNEMAYHREGQFE